MIPQKKEKESQINAGIEKEHEKVFLTRN